MKNSPEKWYPIVALTLILSLLYSLHLPQANEGHRIEFLTQNNALADSILRSMELKDKAMVLVSEQDSSNAFFTHLALNDSSIFDYRIPLKAIVAVPESDFKNFADYTVYKAYLQGIDLIELNWQSCKSTGFKADSNKLKLYQERLGYLAKKLYDNHIHLSIPYINTSSGELDNFYKSIFPKNITVITIDSLSQAKELRELGFRGLIAIKLPAEKQALTDFLVSDADLILTQGNKYEYIAYFIALTSVYPSLKTKLNRKTKRIIKAKIWSAKRKPPKLLSIYEQKRTIYKVMMNSTTVLARNQIPIKDLADKTACVFYHGKKPGQFIKTMNFYLQTSSTNSLKQFSKSQSQYKIVVLNSVLTDSLSALLDSLSQKQDLIFVNLNNPQNLNKTAFAKDLIHVWGNQYWYQTFAAEAITGGIAAKGNFPCTTEQNNSIVTEKIRLGMAPAEIAGLNSQKLTEINPVVHKAISNGALPGCQIFVAKNGYIVLNRAYGWHTYRRKTKVKLNDLYDVASITKVAATTLAAMKLYDEDKLDLDKPLAKYFKNTKINYKNVKSDTVVSKLLIAKNEKEKYADWSVIEQKNDSLLISDTVVIALTPKLNIFTVTPRELLIHKSGITPAPPILKYINYKAMKEYLLSQDSSLADTLDYESLKNKLYSKHFIKDTAEIEVAQNMFLYNRYKDTLWEDFKRLRVWSKKRYAYSDVNMVLMQILIDTITGTTLDTFVTENFYVPMALQHITFKPLAKFSKKQIVPTEQDTIWRKQTLQGYVHDPTSAIMGGVAGNAGLFSNAYSIGVLFQMLLDKGTYGGKQYLSENTVNTFTKTQQGGYRGLGFDKWTKHNIIAPNASINSFGHTGFTGCAVWADPDNELVFVFLSNRVYPTSHNWKINTMRIRQKIHQKIYDSIEE